MSPLGNTRATALPANSRWQLRTMASKTGCASVTEPLMTRRISAVAVCCSSASLVSEARCSLSLNSRCVSSNRRAFSSAHAHAARQCLQETHIRIGERVLAIHVGQLDHPAHLVARDHRHEDHRLRGDRAKQMAAVFRERLLGVLVDDHRFASPQDVGAESDVADRIRRDAETLPAHGQVREAPDTRLPVDDANFHVAARPKISRILSPTAS